MVVKQVLGNNIISSWDSNGKEIILMGKGIGFSVKPGSLIDESKILKIFFLKTQEVSRFAELVSKLPEAHIQCAYKIVSYAKVTLDKKINDNIYITLTDHLNFAIERKKIGIEFKNALLWEIKKFYYREYQIGLEALKIIKDSLDIELSEDEAGYIALHIVNAELDTNMKESIEIFQIIQDILNIVRYHFSIVLNEETLSYERFVTHLKFFVQRTVKKQYYETEDVDFCNMIYRQYSEAYQCALKVNTYMEKKMNYQLTDEEIMYLTVHIKRIIQENKE
ncbi:MAG: PRD domain-containing protein [Hungatella sp.]|jgi:beta-glucoside operon transcriptional antiterminator|nr:PRD domain-containing protein [Hungatella sp.]